MIEIPTADRAIYMPPMPPPVTAAMLLHAAAGGRQCLQEALRGEIACWLRVKNGRSEPSVLLEVCAVLKDGRRAGLCIVSHVDHYHLLVGTPEQIEAERAALAGAVHN